MRLVPLVLVAVWHAMGSAFAAPDDWPATVQPFFLSATNSPLSAADAAYLGRFPVVVINHKQSRPTAPPGHAETKQLAALNAVKKANASCLTFFYLNSQIDFGELDMHQAFAAPAVNGSWWLRDDKGDFVLHGSDHIIDFSNEGARNEWIKTAVANVVNQPLIDGIFVDKAGDFSARGVSAARMAAWVRGHDMLLDSLQNVTRFAKRVILNNEHRFPHDPRAHPSTAAGAGQLFERWGSDTDHDLLNITDDMALMSNLSRAGVFGLLARSGGTERGGGAGPGSPEACGAGLAEFLVSVDAPGVAFFACQASFASGPGAGWMVLLDDVVYREPLGRPLTPTATSVWVGVGVSGARATTAAAATQRLVLRRAFESGAVAWVDPAATNSGCVKWASGIVNGTCPPGVGEWKPQSLEE
jgi:hypothetical protein